MIVRVFQMGVLWSVLLLAGCASHQAGTCAATHGRAGGGSRAPILYNRGGGTIRFGTHLDKNYNLHGHKSVYAVHDSVAWEAEFPRELKSTTIYLVIFRQECGS